MPTPTRLEDMTLEQLWQLFPIILSPHKPEWELCASAEIALLTTLLSSHYPKISHIGSTAIKGIMAKPIIDILVEVADGSDWDSIKETLIDSGYICMSQSTERMSFNKGYTIDGYAEKVFHIHIHKAGDNDEIIFRDFLITHPDIAKEYQSLKLSLLPQYRHDRDAYTNAKSLFINRVLALSKTI